MACLSALLTISLAPAPSRAEDDLELPSFLRFSGFGTLGLATSDNSHYGLLRDQEDGKGISSANSPFWSDSRLGLQMDAEITPELSATVQGVFNKNPTIDFDDTIQEAFLKYQPTSWLQLRIGRMGIDSFMMSDQRNVGFTYLWVRPPVEFYALFPVYSYDGADAIYSARLSEDWSLELEGVYGVTRTTLYQSASTATDLKFPTFWGGNAILRDDNWTFRLSSVRGHLGNSLPGTDEVQSALESLSPLLPETKTVAGALALKGSAVRFYSAGIGYEDGTWTGQTEYGRTECDCQLVHGDNAAYAMIGRHFGEWTPFASFSKVWQSADPRQYSTSLPIPQVQQLFGVTNAILRSGDLDQDDRTIGLRWNFTDKTDVKIQFDNYHVRNFSAIWRPLSDITPAGHGEVNIFSASIDFIF
jgi:hypothetical protein